MFKQLFHFRYFIGLTKLVSAQEYMGQEPPLTKLFDGNIIKWKIAIEVSFVSKNSIANKWIKAYTVIYGVVF